jgi:hypothetical protein
MSEHSANVFVSYSHADSRFVAPIVSLLRVTRALVFRDADTIRPGKKWRSEIEAAIQQADIVVVFWCRHSKDSPEVTNEYERALSLKKDVLPVLLDNSRLPPQLSDFHFIDFQDVVGADHEQPAVPLRVRQSWTAPVISAFAVAGLIVGSAVYYLHDNSLLPSPNPFPGPPGPTSDFTAVPGLTVFVVLVLAAIWAVRKFRGVRQVSEGVPAQPSNAQRLLADRVQAALIERLPAAPNADA